LLPELKDYQGLLVIQKRLAQAKIWDSRFLCKVTVQREKKQDNGSNSLSHVQIRKRGLVFEQISLPPAEDAPAGPGVDVGIRPSSAMGSCGASLGPVSVQNRLDF